jgi:hypothetical protein
MKQPNNVNALQDFTDQNANNAPCQENGTIIQTLATVQHQ